ncbi:MAG: hypothetical protein WC313_08450 [Candidatus Kapaibacterium sp.]|jgi:hypothetical protein|nr:hypothetical protein [Candidatus Kapabacteria bacterium]
MPCFYDFDYLEKNAHVLNFDSDNKHLLQVVALILSYHEHPQMSPDYISDKLGFSSEYLSLISQQLIGITIEKLIRLAGTYESNISLIETNELSCD